MRLDCLDRISKVWIVPYTACCLVNCRIRSNSGESPVDSYNSICNRRQKKMRNFQKSMLLTLQIHTLLRTGWDIVERSILQVELYIFSAEIGGWNSKIVAAATVASHNHRSQTKRQSALQWTDLVCSLLGRRIVTRCRHDSCHFQ